MSEDKTGSDLKVSVCLSKVTFNDGTALSLAKDDILVLVGPNNTGKSQALKDIDILTASENALGQRVIVKSLEMDKENTDKIKEYIELVKKKHLYVGNNPEVHSYEIDSKNALGNIRSMFICVLSTENRLTISNPVAGVDFDAAKKHPVQVLHYNELSLSNFNEYFQKAFGVKAYPSYSDGKMTLKISENFTYKTDDDGASAITSINNALGALPSIHQQGDGMRSFSGILLNLLQKQYDITIIDEPESFLHPPQAYIMGTMLNSLSVQKQLLIATHSIDMLKGLLEKNANRVKLVRITREKNTNKFSLLDNALVKELMSDSILKHTDILNGLFYDKVILCESDTDCQFYSAIAKDILGRSDITTSLLFIHSNGKDRMPQVSKALKPLNVNLVCIVDIDFLRNKDKVKQFVFAHGGDFSDIEKEYQVVIADIASLKSEISALEAQRKISEVFCRNTTDSLSKESISEIQEVLKTTSKWGMVKKAGKSIIPNGNASAAFDKLSAYLKQIGIFIVEVGEIENFIKQVGGHGSKWVTNVFEKYPDISNNAYQNASRFISEVIGL